MINNLKRTKIIATLGPATDSITVLEDIIRQGVDLVRINFSHGSKEDHTRQVQQVRECASKLQREVGILADLQGPKIRIARFKDKKVHLEAGQTFVLDADLASDVGDETHVSIDYKQLPKDVSAGDILLLDDGRIIFSVTAVEDNRIICNVLVGGELSNNKGINRQGGGLSADFLTSKDKADMQTAIALDADYIAISFPRNAHDVNVAKALIEQYGGNADLIAKIERSEAIADIDAMITAADAIMVARGDLGVEIGDAELPTIQKMIIHRCRDLDTPVITATQMMETMITNTIPTRAEVSDVANAVMDGTDAVMLSAETAMGKHPAKVIEATARICRGAERNRITQVSTHRLDRQFQRIDEAIAMAVMYTANHLDIKAIIALTESGATPLWMSRIRSGIPIYGLSRHVSSLRRMTLFRGVYPVHFDVTELPRDEVNKAAIAHLKNRDILQAGDIVILSKGDYLGIHGGTNAMKIIEVT